MPKKFFAIKKGHQTGIFNSWLECKDLISGYPNAEFKGFDTLQAAQAYLDGTFLPEELPDCTDNTPIAYVDGSYDIKTERYAYGCVIITPKKEVVKQNGIGDKAEAKSSRNVAGELTGAMFCIHWAAKNGYKSIKIYHDYEGIAKWFSKEWKAESYVATEYVKFLDKYSPHIKITFEKVTAHTGVALNEEADRLAKEALK